MSHGWHPQQRPPAVMQHALGVAREHDVSRSVVTVGHHDYEIRLQLLGGLLDRAVDRRGRRAPLRAKAGRDLDLGRCRAIVDVQEHELWVIAARKPRKRHRRIHRRHSGPGAQGGTAFVRVTM